MKIKIKVEKEIELGKIILNAEVRYWEDSSIDGVECLESGEGVPCRKGALWCPVIEIETGKILNWEIGKTAFIHFKICDQCAYSILDIEGNEILKKDWSYVPDILCPEGSGYGDYIIMRIDANGNIENWQKELIRGIFSEEEEE